MSYDVIKPKCPDGPGWQQQAIPAHSPVAQSGYTAESWYHAETGLFAISAVEVAESEIGAEFHLSVSKAGGRCLPEEGWWVCHEFGIPEADEDNHIGGITRNYWRPVADALAERICPCKDEEPAIVEDGGAYVWRPLE